MSLRCLVAAWVITGFLFSLHGRVEPELGAVHSYPASRLFQTASEDEATSGATALPLEDHKDRHGCYHTHAIFNLVVAELPCYFSFFFFTTDLISPSLTSSPAAISHPPRT